MTQGIDLFEAISTQRAIRSFKPDPIPDETINRLLQAAVKAPSGGVNQDWRFIVIRDPEIRRKIGDMYRAGPDFVIRADMTSQQRRVYASAQGLEDNIEQAPFGFIPDTPLGGEPTSTLPSRTCFWQPEDWGWAAF